MWTSNATAKSNIKLEGVSSISNVQYDDKGLRVWKAYEIGPGKLIPWEKLDVPENSECPCLTDMNKDGVTGNFMSVKSKRKQNIPRQETDTTTIVTVAQVRRSWIQKIRKSVSFRAQNRDASNVTNVTPICNSIWIPGNTRLLLSGNHS